MALWQHCNKCKRRITRDFNNAGERVFFSPDGVMTNLNTFVLLYNRRSLKASTHGGFAPGACSRVILHVSVHTREHFQVCSICPGILHPNI